MRWRKSEWKRRIAEARFTVQGPQEPHAGKRKESREQGKTPCSNKLISPGTSETNPDSSGAGSGPI